MNSKTKDTSAADSKSSPASTAGPSTEDRLFEAMDRAALFFISILENEEKDQEGNDRYDIQLKMRLFDKGQAWLEKRRKMKPKATGEGEGVEDMITWMNNPATRDMLKKAMFAEGFVLIPEPKPGRPTSQEAIVRQRYQAHKKGGQPAVDPEKDDRGWKAALEGETEQ